jgi:general secretion pathway protein G
MKKSIHPTPSPLSPFRLPDSASPFAPIRAIRGQSSPAFTLIELLVVVTIIAILAGLTLAISGGANQKAAMDKARAEVTALANAIEQYKTANDSYPPAGSGNTVPFATGNATIRPFYTAARIQTNASGQLEDPYGNAYKYESPGTRNPASFDVWSMGSSTANSTDDIGNW